jgi:23S rRNA pseudouridine2605 synthase
MPDRLQKIIAAAGVGSRRKAEEWILEGLVSVDGVVVSTLGTKADPATQRIELNGRPLPQIATRRTYLALHKPRGYASTLADAHAAHLITELVTLPGKPLLRPVGRLDIDSEGLIFLTDDGDFIYHLTHPKFGIEKHYTATVRGTPSAADVAKLVEGVRIDDGTMVSADRARLDRVFPATETADIQIVLHQGRNRIVRRMCSAIGCPVARLVRTQIAFVTIGAIPAGGWRHLTSTEVKRLMSGQVERMNSSDDHLASNGPASSGGNHTVGVAARAGYRRTTRSKNSKKTQRAAPGENYVNSKNSN